MMLPDINQCLFIFKELLARQFNYIFFSNINIIDNCLYLIATLI